MSPHIFFESKSSKKSAIWTLFKKTRPLAKKEGKPCVLIHHLDNHEGFLVTFHSRDLQEVIEAFARCGVYKDPAQETVDSEPLSDVEELPGLSPSRD